jgi:hypothetical protein
MCVIKHFSNFSYCVSLVSSISFSYKSSSILECKMGSFFKIKIPYAIAIFPIVIVLESNRKLFEIIPVLFDNVVEIIFISCDSGRSSNNDFGYSFKARASIFLSQLNDQFAILVELGFHLSGIGVDTEVEIITPNIDLNSTIAVNQKVVDFIKQLARPLWISAIVDFLELGNGQSCCLNDCFWTPF